MKTRFACWILLVVSILSAPAAVAAIAVTGSVSPAGGGSFVDTPTGISYPGPTVTFTNGTTFNWVATAAPGFVFVNWTGDFGTSSANPFNVTGPPVGTGEHFFNLVANFAAIATPPAIGSAAGAGFTVGIPGSFLFSASGSPAPNITLSGTLPTGLTFTGGAGTATLGGTAAAGSAGTYPLTVIASNSHPSSPATQAFSLVVSRQSSTISITSDAPDPSVTGLAILVGYSVTAGATGTVTVSDGTNSCTGTPAAGSCVLTPTTAGAKTLTASYGGSGTHNPSSSAGVSHTVNKANTTATISTDAPDPSAVGQNVTVTYSVLATPPGGGTPAGSVTVSDGVDSCTNTVAAGSCVVALSTAGNRTLTATYAGNANYNGSTSVGVGHAVRIPPTITKGFSPATIVGAGTSTITFTVANPNAALALTGVAFSDVLPTGMFVATPVSTTNGCGGSFTTVLAGGENAFGYAGGSLASSASCTITVLVDVVGLPLVKNNTTTAVSSTQTGAGATSNTATLTVQVPPELMMSFAPPGPLVVGQTSSANFNIKNDNASLALTGIGFSVTLPSYLGVTDSSVPACGGTFSSVAATRTLTLSGASLASLANCSFSKTVTALTPMTGVGFATTQVTSNEAGLGNLSAGALDVVKANTTAAILSDSPDPSVAGQGVTVSYSVLVTAPGAGSPTGNVVVSDGVNSCTNTVAAGSCVLGLATVGARTLTATYQGDSNFNASAASPAAGHQVNKADTTAAITSDPPDPSVVGQGVTVGYTVSVTAPGAGTPTGNVLVSDGVNTCTGTVAAGRCVVSLVTPGTRTLTATYQGSASFNASPTSPGTLHQVDKADTVTTITSDNPDPSTPGQNVNGFFSVAVAAPGSGTPTGSVTISDGVNSCTGSLAGGTGSCIVALTTTGNRTLTATYLGDASFNGSSDTEPHTVSGPAAILKSFAPTQTVVNGTSTLSFTITNPNPSLALSAFAFTDAFPAGLEIASPVTSTNTCGGSYSPALAAAATSLGYTGGTLVAGASCTLTVLVRATTAGVKNNTTGTISSTPGGTGATSNTATLTVVSAPALAKTFTPATVVTGQPSSLGFTITNSNATVAQTGLAFTDVLPAGLAVANASTSVCGGGTLTVTAATRTITLTGGSLAAGSPVTCTFAVPVTSFQTGAFPNVTGAISSNESGTGGTASATLTVNKAATSAAVVSDAPDPSVFGQAVTVSYSVSATAPGTGTPTGNVLVSDGVNSCTGTVAAGSCLLTLQTPGVRTITATFQGDVNYNASAASPGAGHQVNKASTTATITSDSPDPSNLGQNVTIAFTVVAAAPGAGTPTGNVTVSDGVSSCTATVAAGSCVVAFSTAGPRTLTATYAGDANFNGTTSAGVPHTVGQPPTISKAFTPAQVPVNGTSTLTFTIANPNAAVALTGIGFADAFPAGLEIAAPVASTNTCGGSFSPALAAAQTGLGYTAGTLAASGSCTISVAVKPTTAGVKVNTTGLITSTEGGTGTTSNSATLTAVAPPGLSKGFLLTTTVVGQTTGLQFSITNPNATVPLTGVSFTDVLPAGLAIPNGTTSACNGTLTTTAATRTVSLTGATLVAGSPFTCSFTLVFVTGTQPGTFVNVTQPITSTESGPGLTATATLVVNKANTTTTITSDAPDPSVTGQTVTVNYAVAVVAPGAGTPTGNVTVTDGVNSCIGTVAAGTCTLALATPGARTLTATYAGDTNFNGSTSAGAGHQVNKAGTTTTITGDTPDPSAVSQPYTVTAIVAVTAPGAGTPTGTVTVSDGASTCTITLPATSCSLASVTTGPKTLTATYNGDAGFNGSVSPGVPHDVCTIPSAAITAVPAAVCESSTGNKASVPDPGVPATYTWGITNGTITAGAGTREITYSAGVSGTVGLTVTVFVAPPCVTNGTATITINPLPDPTISTPASVCAAATGVIASVPDAGPSATYTWTIVNGSITAGAGTRSITYTTLPSSVTSLAVTVNRLNCVRSATAVIGNTGLSAPVILPVDFSRAPQPNAVSALSFCAGAPLGLRATEGYTSYVWYLNGMPIPGATSSIYSVASATLANAGSYTVTGSRDGCTSPASPAAVVSVTSCPVPTIASVSPLCASVIGGRVVTVTGTNFQPGATLTLAGTPATVTSVTPTSIVATAAARTAAPAVIGSVVVTNPDTQTATLANGFSYALRGDANDNGALTAADTYYLNAAVFSGGPAPATLCNGDANGNGATTGADYFFLNMYVFLGGPPPGP